MSVRKVISRGTLRMKPSGSRECISALKSSVLLGCYWVVICLTYLPEWLEMSRRIPTPKSRLAYRKKQKVKRGDSAILTLLSLLHTTTPHSMPRWG